VPLSINIVLTKFCSLRCYSKFVTWCKFLCYTFSVKNYFLFTYFLDLWQVILWILIFQKVANEAQRNKNKEITEFWRGRQCLISRPHFKNRQEFICKTFNSLEK